jgi:hypothetical protein
MHAAIHAFMFSTIHDFKIAVKGVRFLATVYKPSDLVLSPPYHDMIPYSGSEWGRGGGNRRRARRCAAPLQDFRPAMAQPLNRNLSGVDLLVT